MRYYFVSLLIHLVIFAFMILPVLGPPSSEDSSDSPDGKAMPKKVEVEIIERVPEVQVPIPQSKEEKKEMVECKNNRWYGGIGIVQNYLTLEVNEIIPGYSAEKAGLKVGDVILSASSEEGSEIRESPGSPVVLIVDRGGTSLVFKIIREKICLEEM